MAPITNYSYYPGDGGENMEMSHLSGNTSLPYDDLAMINPNELATFPKQVNLEEHRYYDHQSHLVNRRTPAREGRNITRTDSQPSRHGL